MDLHGGDTTTLAHLTIVELHIQSLVRENITTHPRGASGHEEKAKKFHSTPFGGTLIVLLFLYLFTPILSTSFVGLFIVD